MLTHSTKNVGQLSRFGSGLLSGYHRWTLSDVGLAGRRAAWLFNCPGVGCPAAPLKEQSERSALCCCLLCVASLRVGLVFFQRCAPRGRCVCAPINVVDERRAVKRKAPTSAPRLR